MVKPHTDRRFSIGFAISVCIFFVLAGQLFIPLLGVQNDEALFGYAFLQPRAAYTVQLGHSHLPLMLMSYVGTLKAWIYRPVFALLGPDVWTVREPALLIGAASIWVFFLLLRRAAGTRSAVIGCGLLAVDAVYLLTSCFDWGPVALQHLLLLGGMYLLLRFHQEGGNGALAGGFLLFGLAMWDKALASWMLGALGVAALVVFPRQLWRAVTLKRLAIAAGAFALGALPLIVYNARTGMATFRGQQFSTAEIGNKAIVLRETAFGSGLMGWMVNDDWQTPQPHQPSGLLERASAEVADLVGHPRHNLFLYGFLLALLLTPLARGKALRAILFALVAMAAQWGQMAIVVNAGGGVHHSILLWPLPQMVVGVSFAAASRRIGRFALPVTAAVLGILMVSSALQINEYYRLAWRNGGGSNWTDAIFNLSFYLKNTPAKRVYCMDWGLMESLRILNRGKLPILLPPEDEAGIREAAGRPDDVFIAHLAGFEFYPETNANFLKAAAAAGFQKAPMAAIPDNFGKPAYEVYRFAPAATAP